MTVKSEYKFFGGFGLLLGFNILIATSPWTIFSKYRAFIFASEAWQYNIPQTVLPVFLGFLGIFVLLMMTQCKYIIISNEGITYINPLLPFLRKKREWTDYDYFQIVQENATDGPREALWLIKDDILKDRISSFYYTNYLQIKQEIKIKNRGLIEISQYRQLLCWFGKKIND